MIRTREAMIRRVLLATLLLLSSCSSTRIVDSWRNDAYAGRPARLLVMGVGVDRGPRTLMEEEMIRRLTSRGVDARAGTALFPGDALPAKEAVIAKAEELQVDAVMVIRFLKRTAGETHTPTKRYAVPVGFDTSWESYLGYPGTVTEVGIRDVAYDFTYAVLETTLFDRANRQPIWSVLTQTKYQDHPLRKIGPLSTVIMRELETANLLPKR